MTTRFLTAFYTAPRSAAARHPARCFGLLLAACACAAPLRALPGPLGKRDARGAQGARDAERHPSGLDLRLYAAAAGPVTVSWGEFDRVLLDKYARSQAGREALAHLLRARVLEELARESKLEIDPAEVRGRLDDFEREVVTAGEAPDLETYLARQQITVDTLREFMRIALVQEKLALRALGRRQGSVVTSEEQEMWLDEILLDRGVDYPEPPWDDNVAARCGGLAVYVGEYAKHLRSVLPPADLRDACRHLVLEKGMRGKMPDLSEAAIERAVAEELDRRRVAVRENPAFAGLTYDQIAHQRGVQPGALARDPEVVATALSRLWVDRKYDEEFLAELYRDRREYFDGRFGEALDCYVVFFNAARLPNELVPRTFPKARDELEKLRGQLVDIETFKSAAVRYSEHPDTRANQGALGWITRSAKDDKHAGLRKALFARHAGGLDSAQQLVGPLDLPGGVALVWVAAWRPAPDWQTMREYVHRELRSIFVGELLPEGQLVTYLDPAQGSDARR